MPVKNNGKTTVPGERPEVVIGEPLKLSGFWAESSNEDSEGEMRLNTDKGLLAAMQRLLIRNGNVVARPLHYTPEGASKIMLRSA